MRVEDFLRASAGRFPAKTAVVCASRRITYRDLETQANRLARGLTASGVNRGDRVAIYLENSIEAVVSIFAVLKAGAVFVPLNPATKANKLAFVLNNCRAAAALTDPVRLGILEACRPELPHLRAIWVTDDAASPAVIPFAAALQDSVPADTPRSCGIDIDLAALVYTSGSTGRPKGVMLTHLNVVSAATSITTYLENTPDDTILNVLPLSFDYGLYQVLMACKVGATVILERSFTFARVVLDLIRRENVTGLPIVPTISAILLQTDLKKYSFPSLRYITNTGAALPIEHIRRLCACFPHVAIYSMYGLTECKRVSYLPPDQIETRPGSIGRGMPNEEVYLVDESGERLPPGSIGELVVRGSNVMKGYWELPEETAKVLRPGPYPWESVLYTGDLFRTDAEGYLYFLGRKDDIIKTRGEKVSPKEVEETLYGMDGVAEAAVIGVPDAVLGEAIKAVIALRDGAELTGKEVCRHCAERLEDFMVPKYVEFRASLPKTPSGKIAKRELAGAGARA